MKRYLIATAALVALSAQAQLSGPNRTGPGASPGTFQQPGSTDAAIQTTTPGLTPPTTSPGITSSSPIRPQARPDPGPIPRTSIGTPDATDRALTDSLRSRSSFPSSRDWEGAGAPPQTKVGRDLDTTRLTPLPDVTPALPAIRGSETTLDGTRPALPPPTQNRAGLGGELPRAGATDLTPSGVNTPSRVEEKPLDRALTAKIRAQLSQAPTGVDSRMRIAPETVRDLRISTQNGRVVLEGSVSSQAEKELIERRAREVHGVANIENRLTVRSPTSPNSGAPATGEIGRSSQGTVSGQSSQNRSDLDDDHSDFQPDL